MKRGRSADAAVLSPLVTLLEEGVRRHEVVRLPKEGVDRVYTGFCDFLQLLRSECLFTPMSSNRAINADVVQERVEANEEHLRLHGRFCDFGQVNFLVINQEPSRTFFIMDGQHRCATMKRLAKLNVPIWFQFRVKVVDSEADATATLHHFRNSFPSDPRAYFANQTKTRLATSCLARMHEVFSPAVFKKVETTSRVGKRTGDPDRPFLNEYLFFDLLKESGLLEAYGTAGRNEGAQVNAIMKVLLEMNEVMTGLSAGKSLSRLGPGVTPAMVKKAQGCFLGFFRPGKLEWKSLAGSLSSTAPSFRGRGSLPRVAPSSASEAGPSKRVKRVKHEL